MKSGENAAIVPVNAGLLAAPSVVATEDGRVLAAIVCTENRLRGTIFVARVLNSGSEPIFCSVYGESARGFETLFPHEFRVKSGGTEDAQIVVNRRLRKPIRRVILSIRGQSLEYQKEIAVPAWRLPAVVRWAAALVVLIGAALLLRAGTVSIEPGPQHVLTGQVVRIPYRALGAGAVSYQVVRDGTPIAAGSLPLGNGTLMFGSGAAAGTLRARVTLTQLGVTRTTDSAPIAVQTPVPPPQIERLRVAQAEVDSGDRIDVQYHFDASSAEIALLDPNGTVVERAPLDSSGKAMLTAPAVTNAQAYDVRIEANRGGQTTQSDSQILVLPVQRATVAPPDPGRPLAADQLVRIAQPYATGGTPLTVQLLEQRYPLELALEDGSGRTVARTQVAAGTQLAQLDVPPVASDRTFTLVITVHSGVSEQSLILPVPVHAR